MGFKGEFNGLIGIQMGFNVWKKQQIKVISTGKLWKIGRTDENFKRENGDRPIDLAMLYRNEHDAWNGS